MIDLKLKPARLILFSVGCIVRVKHIRIYTMKYPLHIFVFLTAICQAYGVDENEWSYEDRMLLLYRVHRAYLEIEAITQSYANGIAANTPLLKVSFWEFSQLLLEYYNLKLDGGQLPFTLFTVIILSRSQYLGVN